MTSRVTVLFNNSLVMLISAILFWIIFILALAWSIMRYNYSKIPHDITIANSIEGVIVMGIVVSAVPFMFATICTYRSLELLSQSKLAKHKQN